ncbi:LuxR C-terminal-related transcriptional regulator [Paraburkholderia sp. BR10937]|uniref:LuxR C-terminal-related transcriptional regulator n=1 Tax=Paraburkholderia sp. BR10937 TaxID=3236994 RepID=UPI0034D34481
MAEVLGAAEKTIKIHRGRMMQKMETRTLAELVSLVTNAGFELPDPLVLSQTHRNHVQRQRQA